MQTFDKKPTDAVITHAVRSPIGRGIKGSLALTRPDDLLVQVLVGLIGKAEKAGLAKNQIEDVLIGCAMPEGEQGLNVARIAALGAGLPQEVSGVTVNRFCSSGVEVIATAAGKIAGGYADVQIAGGVESMSMIPMSGNKPSMSPDLVERIAAVYTPMGITAENVAKKFKVSRKDQDELAFSSHKKATAAVEAKRFANEIVPVKAVAFDAKGQRADKAFERDELIRPDTSVEGLAALRPAFSATGTVTAGNASPFSDGAAATLIMSRATANKLGLPILGVIRGYATVGVDPEIMGIGPVPAIRKLLDRVGGKVSEIDIFEVNEAFASQAWYCKTELGISDEQLNPNGGAIALGHPLGCSGARIVTTLVHELRRREGRFGLATMCIGVGQGIAMVVENMVR